ncbi:MAG TPA: YdeI/OmpD-associated family protein [Pyrinomonadaceae bacterium]|nr:YdeI/OmpD-associated family protein [Pyrinomonadaceae bacterium]
MKIKYFKTPADLRKWFEKHYETEPELQVGYYKKDSGKKSITWPESVAEALCFGWIDGIRRSVDDDSYTIRFTPRKRTSIWSAINIKMAEDLIKRELMQPAGLAAYKARRENKSGIYAYEQREANIPEPYLGKLKQNKAAHKFFEEQPAWYRKQLSWWIVSAKKEETRLSRLAKLIEVSAAGRRL